MKTGIQGEILDMLSKINGGDQLADGDTGNEKPGFLILPIPSIAANPEFRFCDCNFAPGCPNLTCFIQKNVDKRVNTVADLKKFSLLIVPIKQIKADDSKGEEGSSSCNQNEVAQSPIQEQKQDSILREIKEAASETQIENKETQTQTPMELEKNSLKENKGQYMNNICKDMDAMIQAKLNEITQIKDPTTEEELFQLLGACESEEFRSMLEKKVAEIANEENGETKVAILEDYFMKKGMAFGSK